MAFLQLIMTASKLDNLKKELIEEKTDAVNISKKKPVKKRFRHRIFRFRLKMKRFMRKLLSCFFFERFCYNVRHDGSCENYTLKSIVGFISGFILTYIFFMFFMFQLNFTLPTATVFCSVLGCILMIGLAFSTKVRCVVLLTLPQFFSQKGRQALLAYAFILAISGPARNTLNNLGILSESLACGQEQLKRAVKQIIDVIKKPFLAIKEAIKKVVKAVKEVMKKIKEILLTIKRIIMAILKVIKAAFEFLAKIINICNKELGTPFERCTRVFENAIADCNAKLGPLFSWLCSLTYIVQSVCYLVKFLDLICIIVDFISDSVIGVVIRKVKTFIRHIKTLFYVRIKFSHSFQFQTNSSKTIHEIAHEVVAEVRQRTEIIRAIFKFMTSAAMLFFIFIIFKVTYYRYRFLTSEKFDNKYINKDFQEIDMRRAKLGKETVLPLNDREMQVYVTVSSKKLIKTEKKALAKAASTLATASLKLAIMMASDYCLFWVLNLIQYYGRFQSKVQTPNLPTVHISGNGFLADLLKGIVKAFQPVGIQLEIDTVPCLPTPIPPNYDRYIQIATIILLCWMLTLLEPYGLRLRHIVMCYYHPIRAKQRAIWLYNHIMRTRNSFLKFARRQLRRKVLGDEQITKVTCKEHFAANYKICRLCLGDNLQKCCLLCGEVFRESDNKKPIQCQTPDCPGIYCEQCFSDLQNLCTVCLSPIEYGDLSDISEEKDSSEEEPKALTPKEIKKSKWRKWFIYSKCCQICCPEGEEEEDLIESKLQFGKKDAGDKDLSDEEDKLLEEEPDQLIKDGKDELNKTKDSDYYSSDNSTDYSYSYQYDKRRDSQPMPIVTPFKDVEKQEVPDYASMSSFREEADESESQSRIMMDKGTVTVAKRSTGTIISGTTFEESKKGRRVDFVGVPQKTKETVRKKKRKKKPRTGEERPLLGRGSCTCTSSDTDESDRLQHLQSPVLTVLKSSSSFITRDKESPCTSTSEEEQSPISAVGTETNSDIRHAKTLIPQLDLSHVQRIPIDSTSSSLDSEVKCNHQYVKMMVPELDLSSLTSTPRCDKSYVSDIFGNVKYGEVSESPKSTSSSSRQHATTSELSSANQTPKNDPLKSHPTSTKVRIDRSVSSTSKDKVDAGVSAKPSDWYRLEEKQRKKVKQYYKAVKDIPYKRAEEKRKCGKFMKFVQRIVPKRKKNTDVLPFYSRENRSETELKTFSDPKSRWDASSSTTLHSDVLRQRVNNRENYTSSEEEEEGRVRGGTSGRINNFHRFLNSCGIEDTGYPETDIVPLTNLPKYPKQSTLTKEVLARYFVSIEDLTPTRDCDIPMSAIEPSKSCGCKKSDVLIKEVPEKDTSKNKDVTERPRASSSKSSPAATSSTYHSQSSSGKTLYITATSAHSGQTSSSKNLPAATATSSAHNIHTSSSSNLSEGVCSCILGVPCTISKPKKSSTATRIDSNLPNKESANKRDSLSVIPETEAVKEHISTEELTEKKSKVLKDNSKQEGDNKNQRSLSTREGPECASKYCNCDSIAHKEGGTQTSPSSILKNCRLDKSVTAIKNTSSLNKQNNVIAEKATATEVMERVPSKTDKIVETTEKYPVKESSRDTSAPSTRDKIQQTSNNSILSVSKSSRSDETSESMQLSQSSTSYCDCQTYQSREISPSSCNYSCCKCPPPPPKFEERARMRDVNYGAPPRRRYSEYVGKYPKYVSEAPSHHSMGATHRRPPSFPMRRYMEFPSDSGYSLRECQCRGSADTYTVESLRPHSEHPRSRQKEAIIICSCKGDCRSCTMKRKSPRTAMSRQYRPVKYESSSSSEPEDEEDDDEEAGHYYNDPQPNRHDLPYQNSDDYLDLVQELEETLQSRNRNRVRRAMQEFERRSRYNKPLDKPIIDYDETSESEEPIIQKISQLTSEKQRCCGGDSCTCRSARPKPDKRSQPKQRLKKKNAKMPQGEGNKSHWQMDAHSGEWYKVSGNQPRYKTRRRSRTSSPCRPCQYDCNCCGTKGYDYR